MNNTSHDFDTFIELLRWRAVHQPDQRGYTFLVDGEIKETHLTYGELDQQARAIGSQLQQLGAMGERALLLYRPGLDYIAAFFGCLYAGVIAVPAYPPRRHRHDPRLQAILNDAQATVALTTQNILSGIGPQFAHTPDLKKLHWFATDKLQVDCKLAEAWRAPVISHETLAFLQYTSGSTGAPKGVMLTHGNLLTNLAMIHHGFEISAESRGVSWLPPYHDMGLIGGILEPLYGGGLAVLMSPLAFLQKPVRWLQAISRYRGTICGGPNFAYEFCVEKVTPEQRATLDLSSWEVAFNGAEPVRQETMARFAAAFESSGFRYEAFYPCYGLAEATLIVSGGQRTEASIVQEVDATALEQNQVMMASKQDVSQTLVSSGRTLLNQEIIIVNPQTLARCVPNQVGEIWVSGASVAQGYWNRPEETGQTFQAYTTDTRAGPFLRTGDLGFLHDGELFVTGRLKDLIIIRGRNHYPQDIEMTVAQSHIALQSDAGAAFSVDVNGEERLVVAQEVKRAYIRKLNVDEVVTAIRQAVAEQHEIQVYAILLLKTHRIPKTTSGKIQRHACRAGFLAGSLNVIASRILEESYTFENERFLDWEALLVMPPPLRQQRLASYLQQLVSSVLRIAPSQINPQHLLTALGLDSLQATQMISQVRDLLQVELPMQSLFESATIASLTEYIESVLQEQNRNQEVGHQLPLIVPAPEQRYQPFPLTEIQQAYWVGRSGTFELGNVATHVYLELESSHLDIRRLESAWQRVIERHDMLRVVVLATGEQQILEEVSPYEIELLDLRDLEPKTVVAQLEAIRSRMSHQVLPPDQWPLFEIRATHIDNQRLRLHISLDLLIADASSLLRLLQEWSQLYHHPTTTLTPLELSFRDYVLTAKLIQETPLYQRSQNYWFSRLDSLPPPPQLPLAQNPSLLREHRFKRRSFHLEAASWQELKQRARQVGLTSSGVLLAAFAEVLTVWSSSPQFTLNLTLYNRFPLHPQVNEIIGNTISVNLLAVDNSTPLSFTARANRIQQQLWQDLDHPYISGVQVLRELARRQGGTQRALMPIVFTSLLGLGTLGQDGSVLNQFGEMVHCISQTPQVWLDHQVFEQDGALVFNWDAVEGLFPEGLLDEMFESYCRFLRQLATSESVWISPTRTLVPPAQLAQRAVINDTAAAVPLGMLHTLFAAQVEVRAHQIAVISPRRTLTYLELEQRANQVAHCLRQLDVSPNRLVAIVMEKGWEQIVGVFGVLKAGAAYTPIDANFPSERVKLLLSDSAAQVVLTQSWIKEKHTWPPNVNVICVDDASEKELKGISTAPLVSIQQPNDLAYVLYTSGSTGKPKGVMIEHRNVVNRMTDVAHRFGLKPEDRAIALTALHHDLSIFDIFCMLSIVGGTIVLPDAALIRDPAHWLQLIVKNNVTLWNSVPAFMQMMVEYLEHATHEEPSTLRWVILSGDFIPVSLPDRLRKQLPASHIELISAGGPTETTVWDIYYPIGEVNPRWKSIPYGKPMTNAQYHVLNDHLEPRPVWTPGELYIAGVGLARGYWRNEERTQASFITDPQTGQRLYRSGDLGRYLPDGNLEILGRKDFQVKVRGHRIELGEIEATLVQHAKVQEAVVCARKEDTGKRLVAYVVIKQGAVLKKSELNDFLKENLPDYMIPSTIVTLDALPLTRNGKVDRKGLPEPNLADVSPEAPSEVPKTEVQETLARIVQEVLRIETVGIHHNFFDLGANSLHLVRIHRKFKEAFDREVPIVDLFKNPTISLLTQYLSQHEVEKTSFKKISTRAAKQKEFMKRQKRLKRLKAKRRKV